MAQIREKIAKLRSKLTEINSSNLDFLKSSEYILAIAWGEHKDKVEKLNDALFVATGIKKHNSNLPSNFQMVTKGKIAFLLDNNTKLAYRLGNIDEKPIESQIELLENSFKEKNRVYQMIERYKESVLGSIDDFKKLYNATKKIKLPSFKNLFKTIIFYRGYAFGLELIDRYSPLYFVWMFEKSDNNFKTPIQVSKKEKEVIIQDGKILTPYQEYSKEELEGILNKYLKVETTKLSLNTLQYKTLLDSTDKAYPKRELCYIYYDKDNKAYVSTDTRQMTMVEKDENVAREFYLPSIALLKIKGIPQIALNKDFTLMTDGKVYAISFYGSSFQYPDWKGIVDGRKEFKVSGNIELNADKKTKEILLKSRKTNKKTVIIDYNTKQEIGEIMQDNETQKDFSVLLKVKYFNFNKEYIELEYTDGYLPIAVKTKELKKIIKPIEQ